MLDIFSGLGISASAIGVGGCFEFPEVHDIPTAHAASAIRQTIDEGGSVRGNFTGDVVFRSLGFCCCWRQQTSRVTARYGPRASAKPVFPGKSTSIDEKIFFSGIRSLDIRVRCRQFLCVAKKLTPIKDKLSKTQILDQIAECTELSRKQVADVLESLTDVIEAHVNKRAVGEFVLPGLLKISTVRKPAVKARKGINPFTKEEVMFKAKPASTVVKVRPLKKLKDMTL
jgi:nucleoid DNA-binding protein